ncbi:hypothetical protein ACXIUS_29530 [Bosea thiooxidans]
MRDDPAIEHLRSVRRALAVLRRDIEDMPATWALFLIAIAERPGCTGAWLAETTGVTTPLVLRALQELGPDSARGGPGAGLVESAPDPVNSKRKIWLLTKKGSGRIQDMLSTAFDPNITYNRETIASYRSAFETVSPPRVRTDQFNQSQLTRIKAAASKRFTDFKGENLIAFPLEPAQSLVGQQEGADGESYDGLSGWVGKNRGRWFEMPTIYADEGGVALADFDDPNDAFHFVLTWRGRHKQ